MMSDMTLILSVICYTVITDNIVLLYSDSDTEGNDLAASNLGLIPVLA